MALLLHITSITSYYFKIVTTITTITTYCFHYYVLLWYIYLLHCLFTGGAAPTPSDSDNDMNDDLPPPSSPDPPDLPPEEDDLPPDQSEPQAGRQKAVAAVMELHPPVSCGCERLGLLRRRCSALRTAQCWLPRRKRAVDKNPLAGILVWYTEISPWSLCILFRHSPFRLLAR